MALLCHLCPCFLLPFLFLLFEVDTFTILSTSVVLYIMLFFNISIQSRNKTIHWKWMRCCPIFLVFFLAHEVYTWDILAMNLATSPGDFYIKKLFYILCSLIWIFTHSLYVTCCLCPIMYHSRKNKLKMQGKWKHLVNRLHISVECWHSTKKLLLTFFFPLNVG